MAVTLRFGKYGSYFGNDYNSSNALTMEQMRVNAKYIYSYLKAEGWTLNAIAGVLGNMQHESSINPGRWEGNDVGDGPGYGLTQWTPYTKYTEWVVLNGYSDPSEMDANLTRLVYEFSHAVQYYPTDNYPETRSEFKESTKSAYYLACAFAWNYERSAVVLYGANSKAQAENLTEAEKEANREALRQKRGNAAQYWYEYLGGTTPITPTTKKKKRYKFYLFNRKRKIYG